MSYSIQQYKHTSTLCSWHQNHLEGQGFKAIYQYEQDHRKLKVDMGMMVPILTKDKLDKFKGHGHVGTQSTPTIKFRENLIKTYPDTFEGIGRFLETYHITLQDDAIPVVHPGNAL